MHVEKLIKEYIKNSFKLFKDSSKNLYDEIFDYCYKIYLENLSKGLNEEKSLNNAFYKGNKKYFFKSKSKKINYMFPLIISIISFILSLILFAFEQLMNYDRILILLNLVIFVIFLIILSFFLYSIKTIKIRSKFELIIPIVLLFAYFVILIESIVFFFIIPLTSVSYSLTFSMPWKFITFLFRDLKIAIKLIDPTMISSILCIILSLFYYVIKSIKLSKYK